MFNEGGYLERVQTGSLRAVILEDRHPALPKANEPHCTHSQIISYRDAGDNEIARVHQYLRPDGSLGASGKPDPKRLLHQGVLYRLFRTKTSGAGEERSNP